VGKVRKKIQPAEKAMRVVFKELKELYAPINPDQKEAEDKLCKAINDLKDIWCEYEIAMYIHKNGKYAERKEDELLQ
jgi:hypothetical protein